MQLKNREPLFFCLIFLLNLIPLFSGDFFVTFDGPAHLYNSNIIKSLLLDKQSFYYDYYAWNSEIVPNWIGHSILSFFGYFFPSFVAEKILMIIYSFLLCYGFRYLIKVVAKENLFLTYLIFPFVYMFFFFMGFYNFLIGLGLMFFSMGLFIKIMNGRVSLKNASLLFVLLLLLYFSHAVTLGVFMIFIALHFCTETFKLFGRTKKGLKEEIKKIFSKIITILAIGFIPFFLLIRYFYIRSETDSNTFMSNSELVNYFTDMKLLIGLNYGEEVFYLRLFLYLLGMLFLVGLIIKLLRIKKYGVSSNQIIKTLKSWSFVLFLMSVLMLFFYVKLPFSDSLASYINTRFLLLFFLFFLIWMTTLKFPMIVKIFSVILIVYIGFNLNRYYFKSNQVIKEYASDVISLSKKIPEQSIVLPINFSSNWLLAHFSNYLGVERDLIILENYECVQDYFPIKWNQDEMPNLMLGDNMSNQFECGYWPTNYSNEIKRIDYVFIIEKKNTEETPCRIKLDSLLSNYYSLVDEKGVFQIYKAN